MASCPGHACFILRHCAYFLSHLFFVSLHSGCVTMCMLTTPLFLHSSFARILTYLVDALAPSGLLENMYLLTSRDPCIRYHLHSHVLHITISLYPWISAYLHPKITTSIFTVVPIYPHTYMPWDFYIPISLFSHPYYPYIPIPTCPYLSLNS